VLRSLTYCVSWTSPYASLGGLGGRGGRGSTAEVRERRRERERRKKRKREKEGFLSHGVGLGGDKRKHCSI